MAKKRPVENSEDLVNALEELFNQVLIDVPEEANDILREAGYDPDQIGKELAEFARQASAKSPLDWRNKRDQLEQTKSQLRASAHFHNLSRSEKEARLQKILSEYERLGAVVAFRNLKELSESDLDSLLAQAEYLKAQQEKKADRGEDEG